MNKLLDCHMSKIPKRKINGHQSKILTRSTAWVAQWNRATVGRNRQGRTDFYVESRLRSRMYSGIESYAHKVLFHSGTAGQHAAHPPAGDP